MTRRHALRAKIALALGSLAISFAAAELFVRMTYRPALDLGHIVPWRQQKFVPPLNEDGFREDPVGNLPDSTRRVLMLGDSFTFGHGLYDGSKRFSDLIEARHNHDGEGPPVHVYNAGVPGTNPKHWAHYLDRLLPSYRPQCVFAVFFLRDGTSMGTSLRFHQAKIAEIKRRHGGIFYRASYLIRKLVDPSVSREFSEWYQGEFHNAYLGNEEQTAPWRKAQEHLLHIRDECKKRDIPFHLVIFPLLIDLDHYGFDDVEHEIERFAAEAGIPCFSLTSGFRGLDARDLWVSPSDQHPNAEGHRVAAETLYPYFEKVVSGLH